MEDQQVAKSELWPMWKFSYLMWSNSLSLISIGLVVLVMWFGGVHEKEYLLNVYFVLSAAIRENLHLLKVRSFLYLVCLFSISILFKYVFSFVNYASIMYDRMLMSSTFLVQKSSKKFQKSFKRVQGWPL